MTIQFRAFLLCAWLIAVAGTTIASEDQYFDSNGVEIRYQVIGTGTPVIMVHGFTANFEVQWSGVVDALADEYQVIGLDARGHGKSGKPHEASAYGIEIVKDIVRLMDHLRIEKAHVAGYSMGGIIALKMASLYPDRVLSAMSGGNGMFTPDDLANIAALHQANLKKALDDNLNLVDVAFPPGREIPPEIQPLIDSIRAIDQDPVALAAAVGTLGLLTLTETDAAALHVPVGVIYGSLDDPLKTVPRLETAHPATEVAVIEGANHLNAPFFPAFSQAFIEFLKQNDR